MAYTICNTSIPMVSYICYHSTYGKAEFVLSALAIDMSGRQGDMNIHQFFVIYSRLVTPSRKKKY